VQIDRQDVQDIAGGLDLQLQLVAWRKAPPIHAGPQSVLVTNHRADFGRENGGWT
jgi:hypothetical protein